MNLCPQEALLLFEVLYLFLELLLLLNGRGLPGLAIEPLDLLLGVAQGQTYTNGTPNCIGRDI